MRRTRGRDNDARIGFQNGVAVFTDIRVEPTWSNLYFGSPCIPS